MSALAVVDSRDFRVFFRQEYTSETRLGPPHPGESFDVSLYAGFRIYSQRLLVAAKSLFSVTAFFQTHPTELLRHSEGLRVFRDDLWYDPVDSPYEPVGQFRRRLAFMDFQDAFDRD